MRYTGENVQRIEDRRILTGRGRYIDDLKLPHMLHAAFLRSPMAHASITALDVEAARGAPGVVAVYTAAELAPHSAAITSIAAIGAWPEFHPLVTDRVRFVGDVIAMVVAESRYLAEDAVDLIEVDYEPLPAVTDFASAVAEGAPKLFDDLESNVLFTTAMDRGDVEAVFASADRVITAELVQHRIMNAPIETRGLVADFDPASGELTVHAATQSPQGMRHQLASTLRMPMDKLRVLTQDVGGSFGLKGSVWREDFCVAIASRLLTRPVKWIEDRNEHLLASGHAREETIRAEVAVNDDGEILGLRAELQMDAGSYPCVPFAASAITAFIGLLMPGPYRWQAYSYRATVATTNKCVYVAYRGPWAVETWARERMLDIVARDLGLDPADVRRRNMSLGEPGDRLITGPGLAGVSSLESLNRALELIDADGFRAEQAAARAEGRYLGLGFATFIEAAPGPIEMRAKGGHFAGDEAHVHLEPDGTLVVTTSQSPHGQGHETTLAQVAADEMGIAIERVKVVHGDTRQTPFSLIGTGGSRASTWASGAVIMTTRAVKAKVLNIAASMLEIEPGDLEIVEGMITPKGTPAKAIPLAAIAAQAALAPTSVPAGTDARLEARERFLGEGITGSGWSGGTHACTVEVDLGTGGVKILRYVVVEDCGRVINPAIVDGQVRGGVAQGIGQVLFEHAAYDRDGNFLAGTLLDYLLPTAAEIPTIEIEHLESGADGEFDIRGVGEAGAIVAPPTVNNAVEDALAPFGARVLEQHLPPAKVLELAGLLTHR